MSDDILESHCPECYSFVKRIYFDFFGCEKCQYTKATKKESKSLKRRLTILFNETNNKK